MKKLITIIGSILSFVFFLYLFLLIGIYIVGIVLLALLGEFIRRNYSKMRLYMLTRFSYKWKDTSSWEKLKQDMTEREVQKILGTPHHIDRRYNSRENESYHYYYSHYTLRGEPRAYLRFSDNELWYWEGPNNEYYNKYQAEEIE